MVPSVDRETLIFGFHQWRHELGNFALLRHRRCDGHIASMHQSGTHWLKFMLANALAKAHGVPPPKYNHANDIISGPKDSRLYPSLPHLISSHSIPHASLRLPVVHRLLDLPRYVVLVRDIRASLVSNFEKWHARYQTPFATFLRGDPGGRRYNSDLWWCFRFLNGWGALHTLIPANVLVLRYEDLLADPLARLAEVARHLHLQLSEEHLRCGVDSASKEAMAAREDPRRPPGAVNIKDKQTSAWFTPADRVFLTGHCQRFLRYPFGYDYARWESDS